MEGREDQQLGDRVPEGQSELSGKLRQRENQVLQQQQEGVGPAQRTGAGSSHQARRLCAESGGGGGGGRAPPGACGPQSGLAAWPSAQLLPFSRLRAHLLNYSGKFLSNLLFSLTHVPFLLPLTFSPALPVFAVSSSL